MEDVRIGQATIRAFKFKMNDPGFNLTEFSDGLTEDEIEYIKTFPSIQVDLNETLALTPIGNVESGICKTVEVNSDDLHVMATYSSEDEQVIGITLHQFNSYLNFGTVNEDTIDWWFTLE